MGKRKRRAKVSPRAEAQVVRARQRSPAKKRKLAISGALAALAIAATAVFILFGGGSGGSSRLAVEVPELTALAQRGARGFETKCAQCHGTNAAGSSNGPPLIHRIYEPSHHGDAAIRRAARFGVRPHHWNFGAMPRVDVSDRELGAIIAYIRELQRANGIR